MGDSIASRPATRATAKVSQNYAVEPMIAIRNKFEKIGHNLSKSNNATKTFGNQ